MGNRHWQWVQAAPLVMAADVSDGRDSDCAEAKNFQEPPEACLMTVTDTPTYMLPHPITANARYVPHTPSGGQCMS